MPREYIDLAHRRIRTLKRLLGQSRDWKERMDLVDSIERWQRCLVSLKLLRFYQLN